jgi:hypothetical protein
MNGKIAFCEYFPKLRNRSRETHVNFHLSSRRTTLQGIGQKRQNPDIKTMIRFHPATCLLTSAWLVQTSVAGPPPPPDGKRWVINDQFSDEFNGTELDGSKWLDHHPNWKGREPGIFLPSQVKAAKAPFTIKANLLSGTATDSKIISTHQTQFP